ncbi:MAG TPA: argininosuccinate lyase [Terriglobales bacterium]|nr:argininosuccinate lyase [Terriglobales bacterium]
MKMWSGRFCGSLDPAFEQWQRSFPFDRRLLLHELEASAAHAGALKQVGILSSHELAAIQNGLKQIADDAFHSAGFLDDDEAEDVHHFVEKKLVSSIGDLGYKLHSGRSRNEQIAADLRLYVREGIDRLVLLLSDWIEVLLSRAGASGDAVVPSYTHLQPAEPVLVAHWLLAYVEMFLRDADRLSDCRKRVNLCPLGSGAVAGATLDLDRAAMAHELGFQAPTANSVDATSDRDFAIEFVNGLSLLAVHLSRWSEEMLLFSTGEYGFLQLPESYLTGSSAMPQKKNPDLLELVRGKAGRVVGDLTSLLVTTKGLPLAYNKDLQETQEPLFHATETVLAVLPLVIGWMTDVQFNYSRMRQACDSGMMNAFAAATYLAKKGVPSRLAHEMVGNAVRLCIEKGCDLQDLSLAEFRAFSSEFENDVYECLTLPAVLAMHNVRGGTAPERVRAAMADAQQRASKLRGEAHAHA